MYKERCWKFSQKKFCKLQFVNSVNSQFALGLPIVSSNSMFFFHWKLSFLGKIRFRASSLSFEKRWVIFWFWKFFSKGKELIVVFRWYQDCHSGVINLKKKQTLKIFIENLSAQCVYKLWRLIVYYLLAQWGCSNHQQSPRVVNYQKAFIWKIDILFENCSFYRGRYTFP